MHTCSFIYTSLSHVKQQKDGCTKAGVFQTRGIVHLGRISDESACFNSTCWSLLMTKSSKTVVWVLTALAQKQAHEAEMAAGHTRLAVVMETRDQSSTTFKSQANDESDSKINVRKWKCLHSQKDYM